MHEKFQPVPVSLLDHHIARVILVAPDFNPHTGQVYTHEVAFTVRPGWSKQFPGMIALPGGKIEATKDFQNTHSAEQLADPELRFTLEEMISAGLLAAYREIEEELGVVLAAGVLRFTDLSVNEKGYTTYAYDADLPEKPELLVKPNSGGSLWMSERIILDSDPKMLPGHLEITRRVLTSSSN